MNAMPVLATGSHRHCVQDFNMIRIGVPKEVKVGETRVGLTPDGVRECLRHSDIDEIQVFVESKAGLLSGYSDLEYIDAGATVITQAEAWDVDLVIKVKEPLAEEYPFIMDQVIYGFFHWNSPDNASLRKHIEKTNAVCIPYESIIRDGYAPCLAPMSAVAGRVAAQKGAQLLEVDPGLLLGGIAGTPPAKVAIVGGGVVGYNAYQVAKGMGADVTVFDIDAKRLTVAFDGVKTIISNKNNLIKHLKDADLIIGAVLLPGQAAPKIIDDDVLWGLKEGAVIVDVAIDEGGCTSRSRPTSHESPTYTDGGTKFYCVPNMPALVPRTATMP